MPGAGARPRVHLELAQLGPADRVLREHAPDGLLDRLGRVLVEHVSVAYRADQAARVAGVPVGALLLAAWRR